MAAPLKLPVCRLDIVTPKIYGDCDDYFNEFYGWGRTRWTPDSGSGLTGYHVVAVTPKSMKSVRLATEMLAGYFRREFEYDFIQYSHNEVTDSRNRIFMIVANAYTHHVGVGAFCFRWRDWKDLPHGLSLAWIWLHPFLRRKGILSSCWERLRNLYGNFAVEAPLSLAMDGFLTKRGECYRCGMRHDCSRCVANAADDNNFIRPRVGGVIVPR